MNKKSFTLIELLVVIAIIGILSSLVIARFSNWNNNAKVANTLQWSAGVHRTLGANLIGYWDFNDGSGTIARDLSGYNNHGTLFGNPEWAIEGVPGTNGSSLEFDGTDDYVDTSFTRKDLSNYYTISLWFRFKGEVSSTYSAIVGSRDVGGTEFFIGKNSSNSNFGVQDGGYKSNMIVGSDAFNGSWHNIVFVMENNTGMIYLNGKFEKQESFSHANDEEEIMIGTEFEGAGYYFKGNISDVRVYNIALTAEEVGRIYAESKDKYLAYE